MKAQNLKKIEVRIGKSDIHRLKSIMNILQKNKIPLLDVYFDTKNPPDFFKIKPILYHLINRFEEKTSIIFFNLPYCILSDAEEHIINLESEGKVKFLKCRGCKFNSFCGGFPEKHDKKGIQPVADNLKQVCIELTNRCNLDCFFCFSDKADTGFIESKKVFSVIEQAKEMDAERIRFTGGEPLLDPNLLEYMKYAKSLGLEVWLNSNATLTEKFTEDIIKNTDSLLVPIHHYTNSEESKITKSRDSLKNKVRTIQKIRKINPDFFLRSGTTINEYNINSLFRIFEFTKIKLNLVTEVYRQISNNPAAIKKEHIDAFYKQVLRFYKKYGKRYIMANAFPFCFFDNMDNARLFSMGGLMDDGRDRLVINAKGKAKPIYYSKEIIGNWRDINLAWNNKIMKDLRNLKYMPKICKTCKYRTLCKGGNRTIAKNISGDCYITDSLLGLGDKK